jgi:hypothetical protein
MGEISYRLHALQQMLDCDISRAAVLGVIESGEVIEATHRTGRPLPTRLLFGWTGDRPLHVLVADPSPRGAHYVITFYEPHAERWRADFREHKERQ